mmetsp:Transcript_29350/g.53720  ORF Transcript_29350/g.53720 Transcript_29350/m.53720 type:complete len:245 (-) Transcript_29350:353-1087(-)
MLLGYLAEHTSLGRRYSGHSWITVRPQPSGSDRGITTPKRVNRTMKIPFVIKAWQGRTLLGIRKGYCVNLVEMRDGSRNGRAMSGMANGNNGRGNSGNKHNGRLLEDKKNGSANSSSSNKGGHINNIISSSSNNNKSPGEREQGRHRSHRWRRWIRRTASSAPTSSEQPWAVMSPSTVIPNRPPSPLLHPPLRPLSTRYPSRRNLPPRNRRLPRGNIQGSCPERVPSCSLWRTRMSAPAFCACT